MKVKDLIKALQADESIQELEIVRRVSWDYGHYRKIEKSYEVSEFKSFDGLFYERLGYCCVKNPENELMVEIGG